ncbi:MAG: DUF5615 family PIN-like protein [Bacteroidota bacterium]|mgnify:CR=1 FL=1
MWFLVDECVGPAVAEWLRSEGHQVFSVYESTPGADDDLIIQKAADENWILITNDRDFGEKVYRQQRPHRGVVFLRLADERSRNKIAILESLLEHYADQLVNKLCGCE